MSQSNEAVRLRAVDALPGGITRTTVFVPPHPPYALKGAGAKIVDVEGFEVLDANNNYTAAIHGHAHPELVKIAHETITDGTAYGLPTPWEVDLAELLSVRTHLANWRFCNSGTEAVMMAIRCARAHTGRDLLIRFSDSYHGSYDHVVDSAAPGIPASVDDTVIVLPQGDEKAFTDTMREHGDAVAAVLIDLMPNRAGLQPASKEFAELVRRETTNAAALLIIDEIITFRIAFGGLCSRYGIAPDIMTVGKIIGGGFPAGAIGGRREVLGAFAPSDSSYVMWGGTFSANPVTMRAGKRALELFDAEAIARLNKLGDELRASLNAAGVRANGTGSLVRIFLKQPSDWWRLYHDGLLVCSNGLMALSTAMSPVDVERIAQIVIKTLGKRAKL